MSLSFTYRSCTRYPGLLLGWRCRRGQRFSVREDELYFSGTVVEHLQARNDIAFEVLGCCRTGRSAPIVPEQKHRVDFGARIIPPQFSPTEFQGRDRPRSQENDCLLHHSTPFNVAFLMKDVVLFAVSFYLLKQDVERASLTANSVKTA